MEPVPAWGRASPRQWEGHQRTSWQSHRGVCPDLSPTHPWAVVTPIQHQPLGTPLTLRKDEIHSCTCEEDGPHEPRE